jgi:putative two-component system response regulator
MFIVDDDPLVRRVLVRILESEGLAVEAFESGDAVLARLQEAPSVDLVLLDVRLPGVGGFEICRSIKASPATRLTPVVIITGLGDVEDRVTGIEAGADEFITKPFERAALLARVRSLLRLKAYTDELEHAESVFLTLAHSIEARDPYTSGHCGRLSRYAVALGRRLGLDDELLAALEKAGVVHDLGKIAIPDAVLLKPGPLTAEERIIIERHPIIGDEICRPIRSFRLVRPIIRHHHERMDGSGYPDRLSGTDIPITARVLQVVDVFDALTTARPYRQPGTIAEATAILCKEAARGWWDPEVVRGFCDMALSGKLQSLPDGPGGVSAT